jgi:hypothetical protein
MPSPQSSHSAPTSCSGHLVFNTQDRYQLYRLKFLWLASRRFQDRASNYPAGWRHKFSKSLMNQSTYQSTWYNELVKLNKQNKYTNDTTGIRKSFFQHVMRTEWQQHFLLLMHRVISLGSCWIKEMDLREKPRNHCYWIMQFDMWYLCRQLEKYGRTVVTDLLGMSDKNSIQPFTAHHMLQHHNTPHLTILYGSYDDLWHLNSTEFSDVFPYNTLKFRVTGSVPVFRFTSSKQLSLHDNYWHETKPGLTSN